MVKDAITALLYNPDGLPEVVLRGHMMRRRSLFEGIDISKAFERAKKGEEGEEGE